MPENEIPPAMRVDIYFAVSQCVIPEEYWQVNENGGKYIEVDLGDDSFTQIGENQIELDRLEEYLK